MPVDRLGREMKNSEERFFGFYNKEAPHFN